MTAVWDSGRYDAGALLVLLAMADYADEEHVCRPSVGALARKARLSERQIIRILNRFKEDGTIEAIGEHKARAGRPIIVYRINIDALKSDTDDAPKGDTMSPLETPKGDTMSPLQPAKGDISAAKVTPASPSKVTLVSYDPSLDPPIDPSVEDYGAAAPPQPPSPPSQPRTVQQPPPAKTVRSMAEAPPIAVYRDVFLRTPAKAQMQLILNAQVDDLRRWHETLTYWCGRGWNLTNVAGMLDLYLHPERMNDVRPISGAPQTTGPSGPGSGQRPGTDRRAPWADYNPEPYDEAYARELGL